MRTIALASLILLCAASPLRAQEVENVMIPGSCVAVSVGGKPVRCGAQPGALYSSLPNGRVMYTVSLSDGRALSFVGESDGQPRPEEYLLYLSRVRLAQDSRSLSSDVSGTCRMSQNRDASVVYRLRCEATDLSGARFSLDYRGNGQRVRLLSPM